MPLKNRLQRVLAEKSTTYWQVLRKFIQAKLTKHEFDEFARVSLGPNHLYLHNTFILSIISNANCSNPPSLVHSPAGQVKSQSNRAVHATMATTVGKPRRAKPERSVTDSPSLVQRVRSSSGVIRLQSTVPNGRRSTAGRLQEEELELLGAPQLLALRRKMVQVAETATLPRVSNDAVRFMMTALQHHMREVMSSFCPHIGPHADAREDGKAVVTTRDVVAALEVNPSILGEDLAINRERALLSLDSRPSLYSTAIHS